MEATVLKAQGKLQAANNAEARTRTMEKRYEGFFDEGGDGGEEAFIPQRDQLGSRNGETGIEEGVQQMRLGVAEDDTRSRLIRAKFGY
jgi:hypothetical protein